jgi:hypothetical protein
MKIESEELVPKVRSDLEATFFIKFTFFVFGVSSISGWNAVLTALDYFDEQYKGIALYQP